jgi:predicted nicotinamide N-methyase
MLLGATDVPGASAALRASLEEQLRIAAGRAPVPEMLDAVIERLDVGRRPASVVRPRDWAALREAEHGLGRDAPYWAIMWPSGEALADAVADAPPRPGDRVLELGCGLALPSLAAARAGARVLASDGSGDAVAFAAHTLALNDAVGDVVVTDWRDASALVALGPFDLVLAADVLYLAANVELLLALLPRLLAPEGEAWIADPGRAGAQELLSAAADRGWRVDSTPDPSRDGVVVHRLRLS